MVTAKTTKQSGEVEVETELKNTENVKTNAKSKVFKTGLEGTNKVLADVHVKLGVTISTAKWEFARIDVGITLPCEMGEPVVENGKVVSYKGVLAARKIAHEMASNLIEQEWKELKETLDGIKNG